MKVVCITTSLKPDGGMGRMSHEVISRLRAAGVTCTIIVQRQDEKKSADAELLPATSFFNIVRNAAMVRRVSKDSDIVHAFDGWPYAIYGYFAVIGTRKRFFVNGIGTYSLLANGNFLKRFFLRRAYRRAEKVLCVSRYMEGLIKEQVPEARTVVAYLGHTELPVVPAEDIMRVRQLYGLAQSSPLVLTVGDIKHRKGQLDTLKAVCALRPKYPGITYVAVGTAYDQAYVDQMQAYADEMQARGSLRFLFDVHSREDIAALFNTCDAYALNSNSSSDFVEGFGLSIIEANGAGKLAVGSRGTGTEEAVSEGVSGYLATQVDTKSIAEALEKVFASNSPTTAQAARQWAARFSWDATAQAYLKSYARS
jgi:glycosyltransferase involved in cell wall biosynthesis